MVTKLSLKRAQILVAFVDIFVHSVTGQFICMVFLAGNLLVHSLTSMKQTRIERSFKVTFKHFRTSRVTSYNIDLDFSHAGDEYSIQRSRSGVQEFYLTFSNLDSNTACTTSAYCVDDLLNSLHADLESEGPLYLR